MFSVRINVPVEFRPLYTTHAASTNIQRTRELYGCRPSGRLHSLITTKKRKSTSMGSTNARSGNPVD